jgi:transcriptional antiterminator Rof (Rho-off)
MHEKQVELEFDLDGVQQKERGTIEDVFSRDGAEYARFRFNGGPLEIRLDRIISMKQS